jgi:hypothetical protein
MSTEVLTQALTAGVTAKFGAGTMFLVIAAPSANLNIVARQIGNSNKNRTFTGAPAGFKFTADGPADGFDTLEVTSSSNQTVQIAVGNDDVSYSNSVTVANTVTTQSNPAGTLSDISPVVTAAATQAAIVAANSSRRRVTIFSDPRNVGDTFIKIRKTTGTKDIALLIPGTYLTFEGTYGIDYNAVGGGDTIYICEES